MQKILIFDFDGTIADTTESAIKIYNQVADEGGYRQVTKENFSNLRKMGAMKALKYAGIPMWKLPFIVRRVRAIFKDAIPTLKPFDGVKEAVRQLKAKGCKLFIISTNSRENIKIFLEKNGITEFEEVYGVSNMFGKGAKIKSLVRSSRWDPANVSYIGDEVRDIEAARKAGVRSVAVTWGYNSEEGLSESVPDVIIREPSDLSSI